MNKQCKMVRDLLLNMAYPDPDVFGGKVGVAGSDDLKAQKPGLNQETGLNKVDIARHLKDCPECRDYADTLTNIPQLLRTIDRSITPDWARLSATIERGIEMRIARERRIVALFALAAVGILAAVWAPLLAWNPLAFLGLQAVGFFGIAIFYLPIHLLRERRGENL